LDAILASGIGRIVVACKDPFSAMGGKSLERLVQAGKQVVLGVCAAEATAWHLPFLVEQIFQRPYFALKWAQTVDGCLADSSGVSQWITGPAARAYAHWLRQKYDAVVVGGRTFCADGPRLVARDCVAPIRRQPVRIVWDLAGGVCQRVDDGLLQRLKATVFGERTPFAYVVQQSAVQEFAQQSIFYKFLQTQDYGFPVVVPKAVFLDQIFSVLKIIENHFKVTLQSVQVEGGPFLLDQFLRNGLCDTAHVFLAPFFLGDSAFRPVQSRLSLENAQRFTLMATAKMGEDVLMEMIPESLVHPLGWM